LVVLRVPVMGGAQRGFTARGLGFLAFMWSSFRLGRSMRGVDVVWGTSPPLHQGLSAWAVARSLRTPWVFEVRDLWPDFAIELGVLKNPALIALARAVERFLYRRADRVIVNSPGFVEFVRSRGTKADRVVLIPNGAEPDMFDPAADGRSFRRQHGLEKDFVALYAGAHGLANDLSVVLDCAELLRDEPRIVLVLLGEGREKSALQARARRLNLTNVRFLPAVPKRQVAQALAGADCGMALLKPLSLFATTYPNKVFDYMAAGRPVLLAIDGPIREVVESAGAGIFVSPGDPAALVAGLQQLVAGPDEARAMGKRGRAYVETHFDRGRLAGQLEGVLKEVVRG
jgi:glycosyltransferase involved in cell wall biosynthesis